MQLLQVRLCASNRFSQTRSFRAIVPAKNKMPTIVRHLAIILLVSRIPRLEVPIASHRGSFASLKLFHRLACNIVKTILQFRSHPRDQRMVGEFQLLNQRRRMLRSRYLQRVGGC